jgi:FkbM family methyltransferase
MEPMSAFFLERTLQSGVTVTVANRADWILYNDIFVDGEYDPAITQVMAICPPDETPVLLDIGANTGFFALRVGHLHPLRDYRMVLIEGSPKVFKTLQDRLKKNTSLDEKCTVVNGLVGEPSGSGTLFECAFHANNSLFASNAMSEFVEVSIPFTNVDQVCESFTEISLLKCDIEGSEELFLDHYGELITQKVRFVVMEFHDKLCNVLRCFTLLRSCGMTHSKLLSENKNTKTATYFFWR